MSTTQPTKTTYVARSEYGVRLRTSTRAYVCCVMRADGWHQFSQSWTAGSKEFRYQQGRGRQVVLVPVSTPDSH